MSFTTSLLVATYNWKEALELVLLNVFEQTRLPNEIVIADDGSRDDTRRTIDRLRLQSPVPIVHVWHPDDGPRRSEIRNRGIAASSSDYIIQIDGDIIPEKRFVEDHLFFAEKGYCVCGKRAKLKPSFSHDLLQSQKTGTPSVWSNAIKFGYNFYAIRDRFLARRTCYQIRDFRPRPRVMGANVAYWKEDAIRINGYDEAYTTWGLEDRDFVLRLRHAGVALRCVRFAANCFHLHHPSDANDRLVNHEQYDRCRKEKRIRAVRGIDQYLE